jgi:hypothetical protein
VNSVASRRALIKLLQNNLPRTCPVLPD